LLSLIWADTPNKPALTVPAPSSIPVVIRSVFKKKGADRHNTALAPKEQLVFIHLCQRLQLFELVPGKLCMQPLLLHQEPALLWCKLAMCSDRHFNYWHIPALVPTPNAMLSLPVFLCR
jgi:hypothetical protein